MGQSSKVRKAFMAFLLLFFFCPATVKNRQNCTFSSSEAKSSSSIEIIELMDGPCCMTPSLLLSVEEDGASSSPSVYISPVSIFLLFSKGSDSVGVGVGGGELLLPLPFTSSIRIALFP